MNEWKDLLKSNAWLIASLLLGIIALVAIVAIGASTGWWDKVGRSTGGWLRWTLLLLLGVAVVEVILGSIVAVRRFLPRYREARFLSRLRTDGQQAPEEGAEQSHQRLREKMLAAIQTLEQSPDLKKKGGLPLYTVPWYLMIGANQSGKTALLRAVADSFTPFARPPTSTDAPTQSCDWWFFNTAIILDTVGSYAFHVQRDRDSAQWYRFLQLLHYYRELQPINGVIVTVAADALGSKPPEELRVEATELRKRIDEAIRELGIDFPIYVLVTRCDLIEGFTEFFGCLPEQTLRQVLGHVNETGPQVAGALPLESIAAGLTERLKQLRVSIFNEEKLPAPTLRQKIFAFPEEFAALQVPLRTFLETLLADNPFQHRPLFRGLFFSSARQQGTPHSFLRRQLRFDGQSTPQAGGAKSYFLHDLFAVILQRDQYLAKPTGTAIKGRLFKHVFGFVGCVVLCILLLFLLTQGFLSDRQVRAAVHQEPCTTAFAGTDARPSVTQADDCRQVVQTLMAQNRQRSPWGKLFFNRSGKLEEQLRQRYVEKFESEVLTPLDLAIGQHLSGGSETIPLVFLLIKRIELINRCVSMDECPDPTDKDSQPNYQLMLDPGGRLSHEPRQVTTLQNTYEAYLRWSSESAAALLREREAHAERLRRWFSSQQFAPREILLWANQNYSAVTNQAFWKGLPAAAGEKVMQVDGAYTPGAWKQSILPFLQRAGDAVPGVRPQLEEFQAQYRTQYFEQWERFLGDFPRGELPWWRSREHHLRLAVSLLDENSPYNRVIDVVYQHLKPLLPPSLLSDPQATQDAEGKPAEPPGHLLQRAWRTVSQLWQRAAPEKIQSTAPPTAEPTIPAWVTVLLRYVNSDTRKAYLESLKQIRAPLAADSPIEKSFQLAQAGFREGSPTEKSTHPVMKAWWLIGQFREAQGASAESAQKPFWPLLERPVLIAWKVILDGAGQFLQKSWAENVLGPTKGLSKMEQANFLYAPQGKVREFVNQFVSPFLVDNESRAGRVLGEEVPLSPSILEALQQAKQLGPILELKTSHRVRVEATRDSLIDSQTNIVEERTEFILECAAKTFKINNRSKDLTEASATIFWSPETCGDALVSVFLSCGRSCVERAAAVGISVPEAPSLRIIKRYSGQAGFLQFIQDFRGGSHVFGVNDFGDAGEVLRRYRVSSIRIFYQLDVPDTLAKLISFIIK